MKKNTYKSELVKNERKRLGFTQDDICDLTGVSKSTVGNWEKGTTSPTAEQLNCLWHHGFDVMLIVTGEKVSSNLSDEEKHLIAHYHNASDLLKRASLNVLSSEPITITEKLEMAEDAQFCEDVDQLSITAVTQVYQNSEGREVNRVRVPIAEYNARNQDKHPLLESFEQLNEANQARLLEMVQNAVYRQQRDAMVRDSFDGLSDKPALTTVKKPRL